MCDELESIRLSQLPDQKLTAYQVRSICAVWYEKKLVELRADPEQLQSWALEKVNYPFKGIHEPGTVSFFWNELQDNSIAFEPHECLHLSEHFSHSDIRNASEDSLRLVVVRAITSSARATVRDTHRLRIKANGTADTQIAKALLFYFCKLKQYAWESLSGSPVGKPYQDDEIDSMREVAFSLQQGAPESPQARASDFTVSRLAELWEQSVIRTVDRRKAEGRVKDYTPSFRKFMQFAGDIAVKDITTTIIRDFRELLYSAPASQSAEVKQMPLRKQVDYGRANGLPKLAHNTVRNHIVHISALLEYAEREDYIKSNVAKKLVPSKKVKPRRVEDQEYFSDDEIGIIFSHPVFTNRDFSFFASNTTLPAEAFYWIPLLSYHFGGRSSEMAERYSQNVFYNDKAGCYILRIDESGEGSVKESSSVRDLPIPQALVELGFIEYAQSIPKGRPLFTNPKSGLMMSADSYRKVFKKFLESMPNFELNGRQPTHCFRHTIETNLRELGVAKDVSAYITGRARTSSNEEYGSYLSVVKSALENLPKLELLATTDAS
jgi:site-specific recombinase XerD